MRAAFIHDGNICVLEEMPADRPHRLSIRLRKVGPHVLQDGEKVLATGQAEVAVMGGWSARSCITSMPAGYGDYTLTDRRLWIVREIVIPAGRPAPGPRAFAERLILKELKARGDSEYIELSRPEMAGYIGHRLLVKTETGICQLLLRPEGEGERLFSSIPGLRAASLPAGVEHEEYIVSSSHWQPGGLKYLYGALFFGIPSFLFIGFAWLGPTWWFAWVEEALWLAGLAACILLWARRPSRVRIDSRGVVLISLIGKEYIPCSEIEALSATRGLAWAVQDNGPPGMEEYRDIALEEYAGIRVKRRGMKEKVVATEHRVARDIEMFYMTHAPGQNLSRPTEARMAGDAGAERAAIEDEMGLFVRDLKRAGLLKDIIGVAMFFLTMLVVVLGFGDRDMHNNYIPLAKRAFSGVVLAAIVMGGYFLLFLYVYGGLVRNRLRRIKWRIGNYNSLLPESATSDIRLDPAVIDSMDRMEFSMYRLALTGVTMFGVMMAAIGAMAYVQAQGVEAAGWLAWGLIMLALGIAGFFYLHRPGRGTTGA